MLHLEKIFEFNTKVLNKIYTLCIKSSFKDFGKGSRIDHKAVNLKNLKYITIGEKTVINRGARLTAWPAIPDVTPSITIGSGCNIGTDAHITACNSITIGDNVLFGPNVLVTDNAHGTTTMDMLSIPPIKRPLVSKGSVKIGNSVWVGTNACILSGVTIGDGAVIGANSVVKDDVPAYTVAAGIPAKIVKTIECGNL